MERRDAVKYISLLLGGAVIGAEGFLTGCKTKTGSTMEFSPEDIAYLDEIAETILPATSTPGAKAAKTGQFMTVMVNDCYEKDDQKTFHEGLNKLNESSDKKYGKDFMALAPAERKELLISLDEEVKARRDEVNKYNAEEEKKRNDALAKGKSYQTGHMSQHYYAMLKQLTLLGFFTSEIGAKQALRYNPAPGRYDGCLPYKKGDRAWA